MNFYRDVLSPKEASDLAGCSVRIILAACNSGALPHRRWNLRNFSIRREDLMAWVKTLDYPRPEEQPKQPPTSASSVPK